MTRAVSTVIAVLAVVATAVAGQKPGSAHIPEARALFERYVTLEQQFDPLVADLYSDEAVIKNKRTYPTGQVREMTLPARQYKDLIRKAMPLAKERGDTSSYSECAYSEEGSRYASPASASRISRSTRVLFPCWLAQHPGDG
jgi:hypothetical protein